MNGPLRPSNGSRLARPHGPGRGRARTDRAMQRAGGLARLILGVAVLCALSGCDMQDMYDQPRLEPLEADAFSRDGQSARPLPPGTVSRTQVLGNDAFSTGFERAEYVTQLPPEVPLSTELLERGRDRFNIYCSPCHGQTGYGDGMIVQRGFKLPPSYHTERLRTVPLGHFFDVITNGYGVMPRFAHQLDVRDRWAVVAYLKTLQFSQDAPWDVVPDNARSSLMGEK